MKYTLLIFLLCFTTIISKWNAQILFDAKTNSKEIAVGDVFTVSYLITSTKNISIDSDIDLPTFIGFQYLGQSTTNVYNIVNGSQQIQSGYVLTLRAIKTGTFTLNPATVSISGKVYKTNALVLKVIEGEKKTETYSTTTGRKMKDAFLKAEVSNTKPYLNEGIVLNLKYYAVNNGWLQRMQGVRPPDSFKGFAAESISLNDNEYKQEMVNGDVYISAVVARYIIFPTQSGELVIQPFEANIVIPSNSFFGDDQMVKIYSAPIEINAKNLPLPKPKSFSGAVGKFNLNVSSNKIKTKLNETVKIKVEIKGKGNLKLLKTPDLIVPKEIEKYPSKIKQNINASADGVRGTITKENILVPQFGGTYILSTQAFSYFDPEANVYKNLLGKNITLNVDGPKKPTNKIETININNDGKKDAHKTYLTQDNYIEKMGENKKSSSWLILGLFILVTLSTIGLLLYFKKKNNVAKSDNIPLKEINKPKEKIQTVLLPKVNIANLKNELHILKPMLEVENKDVLITKFENIIRNFDNALTQDLLTQCQIEKYSPLTSNENLINLYNKVEEFLGKS